MKTIADNIFLFEGISAEEKKRLLSDGRIYAHSYSNGEVIYDTSVFRACLGVLLSGSVRIEKRTEGKAVPLRTMKTGDVFGAASLFGANDLYVTVITARAATNVLFLPQDFVRDLVAENPQAAMNYIKFLSDKVRFLNGKIDFYTAGKAQDKLYEYLLRIQNSDGEVIPTVSRMQLAMSLDMGRASLYRAFEALISDGKIEKTQTGYKIIK